MSDLCQCAEHGEREATIVCLHIVDALRTGVPSGFHGGLDDDNDYQATCDICQDVSRNMSDEEWEAQEVSLGRVLCLECFKRAAEMNGQAVQERTIVH